VVTLRIGLLAALLALSTQARAQVPVSVNTSVAAPEEPQQPDDRPGVAMRELPVESRTDAADFVGRNLPGATLSPHGLLLRGGDAGDTAMLVDGFRLRHLALPLALVDRLDVVTAGYGARWADVAGGTVELTTRRESNRWHAGGEIFHDFRDRVTSDAAASASGPIVPDRLFVLVGIEGAVAKDPVVRDISFGMAPQKQGRSLGAGLKLTWLPGARHRLESLTILDGDRSDNGQSALVQPEAQPTFSTGTLFTSLRWTGLFGDRVTAGASVGLTSGAVRESPMSCRSDPQHCDEVAPIRDALSDVVRQNALRRETQRDQGLDLEGRLGAFLFRGPRVEEHVELSSRAGMRAFTSDARVPGNTVFLVASTPTGVAPLSRHEVAPNHATSSSLRTVHALESTTRLWRRLSLIPGVALVTSSARNSGGAELSDILVTPHAGAVWDVRGDGRWLVRASTHRRVDADLERFARLALPPPVQNVCDWDEPTMQYSRCRLEGGLAVPIGDRRMPRTWEHTAGVEKMLGGFHLGLGAVYRRTRNPRGWADESDTRYRGVTASASGRSGAAELFLAYTLSHHEAQRDLPDDRRHVLQALASYDLFGHGWVSGIFSWESGCPGFPVAPGHVPGIYEDYPASRVVDPQVISSGDEVFARQPARKRFNLQGRLRGKRLLRMDVELWADVINVFDWGWVAANDPFTFVTGYRIQEGRSVRLGLEYRY